VRRAHKEANDVFRSAATPRDSEVILEIDFSLMKHAATKGRVDDENSALPDGI
jgi:hypothetical protein